MDIHNLLSAMQELIGEGQQQGQSLEGATVDGYTAHKAGSVAPLVNIRNLLSAMQEVIEEGRQQGHPLEETTVDGYTAHKAGSVATPEVNDIFAYLNREGPPKMVEERRAARKAKWAEFQSRRPNLDSVEDQLIRLLRAGLNK